MVEATEIAGSAAARAKGASQATVAVLQTAHRPVEIGTLAEMRAISAVRPVKVLATNARAVLMTALTRATTRAMRRRAATSRPVLIPPLAVNLYRATMGPVVILLRGVSSVRHEVILPLVSLPLESPPGLPNLAMAARCSCPATPKSAPRATLTDDGKTRLSFRPCRCGEPVQQTMRPDLNRTGRFCWRRRRVSPTSR